MNIKKVFVWHMNSNPWERAMDRYELISTSFKSVHQRILDQVQRKVTARLGTRKNNKHN